MPGEKANWELHKNATYCFDQILEVESYKTAAVLPFTHKPSSYSKQDMLGTEGHVKINSNGPLDIDTSMPFNQPKTYIH